MDKIERGTISDGLISVETNASVCRVMLNRPEKANALTAAMLAGLIDVVTGLDGTVKVLVLSGRGKVFSAGADLDEAANGLATNPLWDQLSTAIAALPCLTIAALNGTMAGGSFGMGLACDIRIAVPSAKFFYPVMRLGFLPRPQDPGRLVALIGPSRAKMILMGGQKIDATEALNWGLVDRIVEPENLDGVVDMLSEAALSASVDHIAGIKGMVQ